MRRKDGQHGFLSQDYLLPWDESRIREFSCLLQAAVRTAIFSEQMKTSVPGLFAAGDCRCKRVRQLTTAVSDGTIAAVSTCKYLAER